MKIITFQIQNVIFDYMNFIEKFKIIWWKKIKREKNIYNIIIVLSGADSFAVDFKFFFSRWFAKLYFDIFLKIMVEFDNISRKEVSTH